MFRPILVEDSPQIGAARGVTQSDRCGGDRGCERFRVGGTARGATGT